LNSKFEITPYLRDITLNQGVLNWNGNNPQFASLNEVNRFEKVKKGMKLFTSNYSLIFPAGIPIGEIEEINTSLKSNFHEIVVKLSTDFTRLDHVSVVNVLEQEQLQQLDNQISQEENHE
jgi:rod shape-determining protein MreC